MQRYRASARSGVAHGERRRERACRISAGDARRLLAADDAREMAQLARQRILGGDFDLFFFERRGPALISARAPQLELRHGERARGPREEIAILGTLRIERAFAGGELPAPR